MNENLALCFAVLAFFISLLFSIFAIGAWTEVSAMRKSTHKMTYVPVGDAPLQPTEEETSSSDLVKGFENIHKEDFDHL